MSPCFTILKSDEEFGTQCSGTTFSGSQIGRSEVQNVKLICLYAIGEAARLTDGEE